MKHFITWYFKRVPHAFRGISFAFLNDRSFRWQVLIGFSGIAIVCILAWPISKFDTVLLISSAVLTLITEIQNTAFEAAIDHLHPEQHPNIGRAKDMIAGSVLLSLVYALAVTIFVLFF